MANARHWRPLFAGLVLAVAQAVPTLAQGPPLPQMAPPPPVAPTPGAGLAIPLQHADPVAGASSPMRPEVTDAPAAPGAVAGCSCGDRRGMSRWWWHRTRCKRLLQDKLMGYPEEFNEWPLGMALTNSMRPQVANFVAASMVFYHYDFVDGTAQLNQRGHDKVVRVAQLMTTNFCPAIVERTTDTPLDQKRGRAVLVALSAGSFPVPPERVLIGPALAGGMSGSESLVVYGNLLQNTAAGGNVGGANSSTGGGGGAAAASGLTGGAPPR
jgi:hypothetical protein